MKPPLLPRLGRKLGRIKAQGDRALLRRRFTRLGVYETPVICVGRNKTGTTTMKQVFDIYGFRTAPQAQGEDLLAQEGYTLSEPFWEWMDHWEAFQDIPFSHTRYLEQIIARWPQARYILTVREPDEWFASLFNHHLQLLGLPSDASKQSLWHGLRKASYIRPGYLFHVHTQQFDITEPTQLYDRAHYIENYHRHVRQCRDLLASVAFLEINLREETTTASVCNFLGVPTDMVKPLPHANRRR